MSDKIKKCTLAWKEVRLHSPQPAGLGKVLAYHTDYTETENKIKRICWAGMKIKTFLQYS